MKRVIFELTMPNVGSWNGKWTGAENKHTVAMKLSDKEAEKIVGENFYYNFGDGWGANINVRLAKPREKATNKFCGYNWMIDSIMTHGEIKYEKK